MSTAGATALTIVLYALPFVAVALIGWSSGLPRTVGAILSVVSAGFVFGQTGILSSRVLAETDVSALAPTGAGTLVRCEELFEALRQARIMTDGDGEIPIQGVIWDRLPAEAQEALTECAALSQTPLEVNIIR